MTLESSSNPYLASSSILPESASVPDNVRRTWGIVAVIELFAAVLFLLMGACLLIATAAFLVWAIRQGNVPVFGMIMAASLRAVPAIMLIVPGILLLIAAGRARQVAQGRAASMVNLFAIQKLLLVCLGAIVVLFFGLTAAFFLALSQSNM